MAKAHELNREATDAACRVSVRAESGDVAANNHTREVHGKGNADEELRRAHRQLG